MNDKTPSTTEEPSMKCLTVNPEGYPPLKPKPVLYFCCVKPLKGKNNEKQNRTLKAFFKFHIQSRKNNVHKKC